MRTPVFKGVEALGWEVHDRVIVSNNPVNYYDPDGLIAIPFPLIIPELGAAGTAGVAGIVGVGSYALTSKLIEGTWLGNGGLGNLLYDALHPICKESNPPYNGPPDGWVQGPRRGRKYGPDGRPQFDIDKPHQGEPAPHVHEWPNGEREHPGRPVSPWPPQ